MNYLRLLGIFLVLLASRGLCGDGGVSLYPAAAGGVKILSPNGGESFAHGSTAEIRWTTFGAVQTVIIEYTCEGPTGRWLSVGTFQGGPGSIMWPVPDVPVPLPVPTHNSSTCLVRVRDSQGLKDESDDFFSIGFPTFPCTVTTLVPPGQMTPVAAKFQTGNIPETNCMDPYDHSTGCIWDFGNHKWSYERNPETTYFYPGVFTWTFKASDARGVCAHKGQVDIPSRTPLLLSSGRIRVTVGYVNPWSQESGDAQSVQLGDGAGYFFFFGRDTPEVVVKVLDPGPDAPYQVYWSSMTHFTTYLTLTNLDTGQSLVQWSSFPQAGFEGAALPKILPP